MRLRQKQSAVAELVAEPSSDVTRVRRARLSAIGPDGSLRVITQEQQELLCDWLETGAVAKLDLKEGDSVLVVGGSASERGIVLGRVGPYRASTPAALLIETTESMTLKCGSSSMELRADGKLLVKGEDVLLKARGTQRIKAGSVNIN